MEKVRATGLYLALFLLGLFLFWAGVGGRLGVILGALLCPSEMEVP